MKKFKTFRTAASRSKFASLAVFVLAFAAIGGLIVISSRAATGVCSTAGVVGTATQPVAVTETAQYRLWVRMRVPDTTNTGNNNGVRIELDGNGSNDQCFTVTTTSSSAVSQWAWVKSDALASSTDHVTSSLAAGNYTTKILGLKAGVLVDKILLLRSDNTCTPDNTRSTGREPGDNCITPVPTVTITADATSVTSGGNTTIRWNSTNATGCTATGGSNNWAGARAASSTFPTGALTTNQTYTIFCSGVGGQSSAQSVTVNVTAPPAPTLTLTASPTSVVSGSASTLTWNAVNATSCTATGSWTGSRDASAGNHSQSTGNITANQTYNLSCTGAGGSVNRSVTVTVTATPPPADTEKPVITMGLPSLGTTTCGGSINLNTCVRVDNRKTIEWRPLATDNSGNPTVVYRVNGQAVTLTNGAYIFGGRDSGRNGNYTLRVEARDAANNQETTEITIRLRHPDIDRDGIINFNDVMAITNRWRTTDAALDLNNDGTVSFNDVLIITSRWRRTD